MKLLLFVIPSAICGIVSQIPTAPGDTLEWSKVVVGGGSTAVLGWCVWYGYTYIVPRINATLDRMMDKHAETVGKLADTFKSEMSQERHAHKQELQAFTLTMREQSDAMLKMIADKK